jgi:hypothetical protein
VVSDTEREMLGRMAAQLKISADRSEQILDVVGLLHRDSLAS